MTDVEIIFGRSIEKNRLRYTEYYMEVLIQKLSAVESIHGNNIKAMVSWLACLIFTAAIGVRIPVVAVKCHNVLRLHYRAAPLASV